MFVLLLNLSESQFLDLYKGLLQGAQVGLMYVMKYIWHSSWLVENTQQY